jgi:hypothetical protein
MINDDVLNWCGGYKGEPFHALLTDPPYELNFMGKDWDNTGITFRKETWIALSEHLHDGAFIIAFASSRGFHRMAMAMEDAGLIMHPFIGWIYGSGFPKATRIDTQIDKQAGAEREVVGRIVRGDVDRAKMSGATMAAAEANRNNKAIFGYGVEDITEPSTLLAKAFVGHRYGLQALKPALEPILVFQKPYKDKPIDDIIKTGAGALNIDGGRIGKLGGETHQGGFRGDHGIYGSSQEVETDLSPHGRWPANVVLSHTPECRQIGEDWECPDYCPIRRLGEQSGETSGCKPHKINSNIDKYDGYGTITQKHGETIGYDGAGTASRYFYNTDYRLENTDPFIYQAKASRSERDEGLKGVEEVVQKVVNNRRCKICGRQQISGSPCQCENPDWEILSQERMGKNNHPTVKPISLAKHLATLLLPPKEYAPRRILVPFAGVGSECIGAFLAGWEEIVGIEIGKEYCEIAEARLEYWKNKPRQFLMDLGL